MTFAVEADWQTLNKDAYAVSLRMPIISGDPGSGDDYGPRALIENERRVRATRFPTTFATYTEGGLESQAGPGGGTSDWAAVAEYGGLTTQDGFTGTLDVTAWIEDCEASGGLYVAILNTSKVVQASATLVNTATGTAEEITGTITGLSASTDYLIEVRFSSTVAATTGYLYGVLVEPEDQAAGTLG